MSCTTVEQLLAGLLRSVKARRAREWIIVGDGAPWIWDRVDELVNAVGYNSEKVTEVVDIGRTASGTGGWPSQWALGQWRAA